MLRRLLGHFGLRKQNDEFNSSETKEPHVATSAQSPRTLPRAHEYPETLANRLHQPVLGFHEPDVGYQNSTDYPLHQPVVPSTDHADIGFVRRNVRFSQSEQPNSYEF